MERLDEHSYLIMQVISTSGFVFRIGNVTSISIVVVFVVARCVCPRSAGGSAAEAEGSGHAACRLSLPFPVAVAPRTLLTLFRTLRLWVTLITNYSPWVQLWYCKLKVYIYPTWRINMKNLLTRLVTIKLLNLLIRLSKITYYLIDRW